MSAGAPRAADAAAGETEPERPALPNHACPLCGGPNACAPAASGDLRTPCWCTAAAIDPRALARVPAALRGQACLCARCASGGASSGAGS